MRKILVLTIAILSLSAARTAAEVRLDGTFTAREACPAFQSIRTETNPGSIRTEPGRAYPLFAKNRLDATHYQIEIANAQPQRRWVAIGCGEALDSSGVVIGGGGGSSTGGGQPDFLLAVSWQPAFCESAAGRGKTECDTQSDGRFDASHFTLHGLWPRAGDYCRVPPETVALDRRRDWDRLPELQLDPATRADLERVMPGTMSYLDRHEWIRHGTCFGGEAPQTYFARAIALVEQLNGSRARELFAGNIGGEITGSAIRSAFDETFGRGAGDRVLVSCNDDRGRRLIAELRIGLTGTIGDQPSLGPLIAAAPPHEMGCPRGIVDPVGLQ